MCAAEGEEEKEEEVPAVRRKIFTGRSQAGVLWQRRGKINVLLNTNTMLLLARYTRLTCAGRSTLPPSARYTRLKCAGRRAKHTTAVCETRGDHALDAGGIEVTPVRRRWRWRGGGVIGHLKIHNHNVAVVASHHDALRQRVLDKGRKERRKRTVVVVATRTHDKTAQTGVISGMGECITGRRKPTTSKWERKGTTECLNKQISKTDDTQQKNARHLKNKLNT